LAIDQDFLATAEIDDDTPVAYHSRRALATAGLERRFGRLLTGGVAFEVEKANVVQLANSNSITAAQRTQHSPMSIRSPPRSAPSITSWWACRHT